MLTEGVLHRETYIDPLIVPEISHAFFPAFYFDNTVYFNTRTSKATGKALEALLHEALHIWDFRHHAETETLLKSPGSFYDKRSNLAKSCPELIDLFGRIKTSVLNQSSLCGFVNKGEILTRLIEDSRWPRRFGPGTDRERRLLQNSDFLPYKPDPREGSATSDYGDLHALDNEQEYFAILMQLYVFDRAGFKQVATPIEATFAKNLFGALSPSK